MRQIKIIPQFWALSFCLFCSCQQQQPTLIPIDVEEIGTIADTNGIIALQKVGLLEKKYSDADDPILMRLALLKTKAKDKADIPITDETLMRIVTDYYEKNGSPRVLLQAYYYLAGTYRDLHDSPKALATYLKAADFGEKHCTDIDSLQLFYVYSQLSELYDVQNNDSDELMAYKKAYYIKKELQKVDVWDYTVLAQAYEDVGNGDSCLYYYTQALKSIIETGVEKKWLGDIGSMLPTFIQYNQEGYIQLCFSWLNNFSVEELPANCCSAKGTYYKRSGAIDSAEVYYTHAFNRSIKSQAKRDCALKLFLMFDSLKNQSKTLFWARQYIENARAANEEMAQEHVTQINNEYKYQRNMEAEARLREEALRAENGLWMTMTLLMAAIIIGGCGIYVYRTRFRKIIKAHMTLKHNIEKVERQRAELALELSDVILMFKNSSKHPNEDDWNILIASVDKAYPEFRRRIDSAFQELPTSSLQLLYLYKAGLKRIEIARAMDVDRSLITRRAKILEERLGAKLDTL